MYLYGLPTRQLVNPYTCQLKSQLIYYQLVYLFTCQLNINSSTINSFTCLLVNLNINSSTEHQLVHSSTCLPVYLRSTQLAKHSPHQPIHQINNINDQRKCYSRQCEYRCSEHASCHLLLLLIFRELWFYNLLSRHILNLC